MGKLKYSPSTISLCERLKEKGKTLSLEVYCEIFSTKT
jgi:hypothetical protein